MRRPRFEQQRTYDDYGPALRGSSHQQVHRQRGLKGGTLGPAGKCRRLSREERKLVEDKMRAEGRL